MKILGLHAWQNGKDCYKAVGDVLLCLYTGAGTETRLQDSLELPVLLGLGPQLLDFGRLSLSIFKVLSDQILRPQVRDYERGQGRR